MNPLYHSESARLLLDMAAAHSIPLLFVTNNTCNKLLRFDNHMEVAQVGLTSSNFCTAVLSHTQPQTACQFQDAALLLCASAGVGLARHSLRASSTMVWATSEW
jgi:ribonucleotide monophosphatase NagD (HAD superfamily)